MNNYSPIQFTSSFRNLLYLFSFVLFISCSGSNANTNNESTPLISDGDIEKLLSKNTCTACHKTEQKLIGPSFKDIAAKNYSTERIVELVYKPEPENWPDYSVPMMAMPHVPENELQDIAVWINSLN
ncbi:MAG: cytochrome C [Cyclobacteriaceae bacterium]|nr:cytochrome C [Cyclobacteriaceae bacterium]